MSEEEAISENTLSTEEEESILREDIESLAAEDVTQESPEVPIAAESEEESLQETQSEEESFLSEEAELSSEGSDTEVVDICQNPLTGPIAIDRDNNRDEVLGLE